jgi:hypothetical protein
VEVPKTWNRQRRLSLTLPGGEEGFTPTIEIIEDWVPLEVPLVLQRLADRRRDQLWRELPAFDALELVEDTLAGRLIRRLEYVWRVEGRSMKAREIMWLEGRFLLTITYADREDRFEGGVGGFEEWLDRATFEPPPRGDP